MKSKLTLFLVFAFLSFINYLYAQDNGMPMNKIPTTWAKSFGPNTFPNLPEGKGVYHNPNTTTRVYHTEAGTLVVPPNVIPFPTTTATESEVAADLMKGNQSTMYAEWNSYGPSFYGTGFCFSNNSGTSWTGNYNNMNPGNNGGDPGPFIWPTGSTWAGRLGTSDLNGAYNNCVGFYSADNGVTWSAPVNMQTNGSVDKNLSCVDDIVGSPYFGRAYTVWSNFALGSPPIVFAYSADGGASWTGYQTISPTSDGSHYCQGCDVKVGPGGVVYVVWAYPQLGSPYTETAIGFAKSTNGGVIWTGQTNTAYSVNGIRGNLPSGVRINGFPSLAVDMYGGTYNGNIYVAAGEKNVAPATDAGDMCLGKSTNGGATWTHTRINQDAPGTGRMQMLGGICVDPGGGVNCTYYDQRNTTGNVCEYWMSRSIDGGSSWSDVVVSDHQFTPASIPGLAGGYQGDYTRCVAGNGKIWPFWMDNSSGHYQVWTVGISYGPPPTHDISAGPFLSLPNSFLVGNNYIIRSAFSNVGSNNETSIPITFWINGVLTNSSSLNLNTGQTDSVSNNWMPGSAGSYQLKYICSLANDVNRTNDTVKTTVQVLSSLPSLCEQFTNSAFPPTGWTNSNSTYCYWSSASGFGIGTGSAVYDYWNGPVGNTTDLITFTFPPSVAGDSIFVDMAYNTAVFTGDSLTILASTDGGSTYISVVNLGGATLSTTTSGNDPFTPTATQWAKRVYPLPAGTNKINFHGYSNFGDNCYIDSTCIGQFPIGIHNIQIGIPKVYSLSQNYPNPFNPTTSIIFGLPKASLVKLVVYDILGRVVSTLVNERRAAGMYNIAFDASNYASGVYFYKLDAGDFTSIKKMILLK